MSSLIVVHGVNFCKNYINKGFCYGLGCKFLHVTREIELEYKKSSRLPIELADQWKSIQSILRQNDVDVCQDQNQSKCFRVNCKFGKHNVFRTDSDSTNIVEFTFRPSPKMTDYIANVYRAPIPYWYSDVLCHVRTPFPLIAQHIIRTLSPFRIKGTDVSFYYNDKEIANDNKITPHSLDIGNGVDVFVDLKSNITLAEIDCAICLSPINDYCYCFPCNHLFDVDCSLSWFCGSIRKNCPLCGQQVDELHMRIAGRVTVVNYV